MRPFKVLAGNEDVNNDKMAYPNAVLAKGMLDYYYKHINSEEAREIVDLTKRYYSRWAMSGHKMHSIHDAYAGMALIDLHQITGDEKFKAGVDAIYQYLIDAETAENGSYIHTTPMGDQYVFAEDIGCVCPFLSKYSATYQDTVGTKIAVTQILNFMAFGIDEKTFLPYHGYNIANGMKMGIIGWGQAVGMLLNGISSTLRYMSPEQMGYEEIRQFYRRMVDKVETYQAEGGLYHWQLSAKEGPADTAATAQILLSISEGVETKVLIGLHKNRMLRGAEALKACIQEDGSVPGAEVLSPEFNHYPMEFGAFPWSLGPTLSLMNMIEEDQQ